jgi:hypothetical protein
MLNLSSFVGKVMTRQKLHWYGDSVDYFYRLVMIALLASSSLGCGSFDIYIDTFLFRWWLETLAARGNIDMPSTCVDEEMEDSVEQNAFLFPFRGFLVILTFDWYKCFAPLQKMGNSYVH